jgi:hypothetical protein
MITYKRTSRQTEQHTILTGFQAKNQTQYLTDDENVDDDVAARQLSGYI